MQDTNSNPEEKIKNVRQRSFAVAKKGAYKNILRTGFLGPCVAFYGINANKGVAFMSHIDGKILGLKSMMEQLETDAEGDIKGFSLYLTTNYTFTLRILVLVLIAIGQVQWGQSPAFAAALFLTVFLFCFGSVTQVYWFAWLRFGTWKVVPNNPWQVCGRVQVAIDASSKTGPEKPCKELLTENESKERYGHQHCWLANMSPI